MTKPQIWVAAFLTLFIVLFILGRLTKQEETQFPQQTQISSNESDIVELTGEQLMSNFGCIRCHGEDLNGTPQGPALINISTKFSRQELITYMRNPGSFFEEDRFKAYRERYPNSIMPDFGNKDVKDLGKIADYLLNH
ncbi:MAG: cytochrome c [Ignavibacteria bacterium]|jgi:hypothetical protein